MIWPRASSRYRETPTSKGTLSAVSWSSVRPTKLISGRL